MRHFYLILGLFSALFITSCTKEPHPELPIPAPNDNVVVRTNITENTTWTADRVWQLSGRITVTNGATLTIQPGTIIKSENGSGVNASLLLIARGAKLIAEGTENAPIIFTSIADKITPEDIKVGVFSSPNLDNTKSGLWGGVIILGKAPISASNNNGNYSVVQIEGIPTSDQNGLYGGNETNDNSGILRHILIRYGGTNIGSGNEVNGLTLGGVGSGTIIDNIEIIANQDDGVEFFGGNVDATNITVINAGDDAIDTDQGWSGTLDGFTIITPNGHCLELDGPEGSLIAGHVIKNGYIIASNDIWQSMDLINTDDNSIVTLENIYFTDVKNGQKINRVTYDIGEVTFSNIVLNVNPLKLGQHIEGNIPQGITADIRHDTNRSQSR